MAPFTAIVPDEVLEDLRARLARTRWPTQMHGGGWREGAELGFVQRLCAHWAQRFDWRAAERRLNALPQFKVSIGGIGLHVVQVRSGAAPAVPLLLMNGWPSSIFEYLEIVPRLTAAGFDVVAPALPGYGFSDRPVEPGVNLRKIAGLYASLMSELGYGRFLVHGSDLGAGVADQLRQHWPERLLGVHFSNVPSSYPPPANPSPDETRYLAEVARWRLAEGAYAAMHATKPDTLAFGLMDSPAGLAAWIVEKFQGWSDGDVEAVYGLDEICANLTLYWATGTIGSAIRLYRETAAERSAQGLPERNAVPVGVLVSPKDILPAPRAWGERWLNLARWTESPRGGHFPAWEVPDLLVEDLRAFADQVV